MPPPRNTCAEEHPDSDVGESEEEATGDAHDQLPALAATNLHTQNRSASGADVALHRRYTKAS